MSELKKEPQRETVALSTFNNIDSVAERIFRSMDPDQLFADITQQIIDVIQKHGLDTTDLEKLYHEDRCEHRADWPQHIQVAVEAFYALHQAERCISEKDASWTAYHMITAMQQISLYNLLVFSDEIDLVDKIRLAQREGGRVRGATLRREAEEENQKLVKEAQKLIQDGRAERHLVSILKQRYNYGETRIRQALKNANLVKGNTPSLGQD